jgi:hypothetical protein
VETLLLMMQRYPIEGFLIASKLSEKNSWAHAKLAVVNILASIAGKKSAGCYSFGRNTLLCLLKRLYWRKVDINKIEWRIMFLSIVAQIDDYWSKVWVMLRLCDLYFMQPNIFTCFWVSVVPIPLCKHPSIDTSGAPTAGLFATAQTSRLLACSPSKCQMCIVTKVFCDVNSGWCLNVNQNILYFGHSTEDVPVNLA